MKGYSITYVLHLIGISLKTIKYIFIELITFTKVQQENVFVLAI